MLKGHSFIQVFGLLMLMSLCTYVSSDPSWAATAPTPIQPKQSDTEHEAVQKELDKPIPELKESVSKSTPDSLKKAASSAAQGQSTKSSEDQEDEEHGFSFMPF